MSDGTNKKAPSTLGERLKLIISEQGLKQAEFARSLGISANYVYLLTSGRKTTISDTLAKLIETTCGYPSEWLLTGQPAAKPEEDLRDDVVRRVVRMDKRRLKKVAKLILEMEDETSN